MKLWSLTGFTILLPLVSIGQNLVPNHSFEEFSECPKSVTESKAEVMIPGWTSPNNGTPDHFHRCANGPVDVPFNLYGTSNPNTGQGYAGIYVWNEPSSEVGNFREYLQCELAEPLIAGKKYKVQLFYKLASYSVFATGRIGLALAEAPLNLSSSVVIDHEVAIGTSGENILSPTGNWVELSGEITAKGGEQVLVIGNFFNNENTKSRKLPHKYGKSEILHASSYFYVDDVSVVPVETGAPLSAPLSFDAGAIAPDVLYELTTLRFEFDGEVLVPSSFDELDKVADYLVRTPAAKARLYGHVQTNRSDEFNQTLSEERSRSVAQYLVDKGVDTRRIVSYGYGMTRPKSVAMTDEARKTNNRIEIKFITNY